MACLSCRTTVRRYAQARLEPDAMCSLQLAGAPDIRSVVSQHVGPGVRTNVCPEYEDRSDNGTETAWRLTKFMEASPVIIEKRCINIDIQYIFIDKQQ